jgi:nucleoside-diphosphate-sugar epimerase
MKEYLTGASGFLGRNLAEKLKGEVVTIPHADISFTILEPFDRFFFLSAYGNMSFHDDDDMIIKANLLDLVDMATQAKKFDFKSFVYVSTSSVKLPRQTMYSRTKRAAEEVLLALTENTELPFCVIRPYSITGVGEQEEHLIPKLIDSCFTGKNMTFVPGPVHDFIDVTDVAEAIINLSEAGGKGIYEVGTGVAYTNQDVLDIVENATGKRANVTVVPNLRDYDSSDWVCKNFRARTHGWLPKKTLEDSIGEMVEAYKDAN